MNFYLIYFSFKHLGLIYMYLDIFLWLSIGGFSVFHILKI